MNDISAHWIALLTRSNFENTVMEQVQKKKFDVFLPLTRKKSRRRDRSLMIHAPLFPGYLFVKTPLDPIALTHILKSFGAVRFLGSSQGAVPIPDSQINSLRIMTDANAPIITGNTATLRKGDPVLVLEGPMAGLTGEFFQYRGVSRVIVKIEIMGRYAGVEIDREKVEQIPNFFP